MPPFEHDELPETQRVVAPARYVFVDEVSDEPRLEVSTLQTRWGEQRVGEELAQVAAEPDAKRDAEALLATVENLGRQQGRRDLLQDVLATALADLHSGGQGRGERDHVVVEQWH